MLKLTQQDTGKKVVIGTPIDPEKVWEVYPEQIGTVTAVRLLMEYDEEPGDADWAMIRLDPEFRVPENEMGIISVPFCCILRYVD
jgi:hypothetical protein